MSRLFRGIYALGFLKVVGNSYPRIIHSSSVQGVSRTLFHAIVQDCARLGATRPCDVNARPITPWCVFSLLA